jgi:hypothetical protein
MSANEVGKAAAQARRGESVQLRQAAARLILLPPSRPLVFAGLILRSSSKAFRSRGQCLKLRSQYLSTLFRHTVMDPDFYDDDFLPRATPITVPDGAIELYPRPMGPKIFLLPKEDRILKVGISVKLSEAEAMRFVASKTSIPVPAVHDAYEQEAGAT